MTTTTICELDGCTADQVHGLRHAISTVEGIDNCSIYTSARGDAFLVLAQIALGTLIDVAHTRMADAVAPFGVTLKPAQSVSPVNLG